MIRCGIRSLDRIECGTEVALYKNNRANLAQTARQPFQTLILSPGRTLKCPPAACTTKATKDLELAAAFEFCFFWIGVDERSVRWLRGRMLGWSRFEIGVRRHAEIGERRGNRDRRSAGRGFLQFLGGGFCRREIFVHARTVAHDRTTDYQRMAMPTFARQ